MRVSVAVPVQPGKLTAGRAKRPAHVSVRLERASSLARGGDDEASERRPRCLAVRAERPPRAIRLHDPQPASDATSSRPGAGSEKSAGCAVRRRPPRESRRSPPGRAATRDAAHRAAPARARPRAASAAAPATRLARRERRRTTSRARSRAASASGTSTRSSSSFTAAPASHPARAAAAS